MEFEGKRVLVTGGTRGVGRSIVEEFLKAGAQVAINGTSGTSVDKALAQLEGCGKVVPAPGDLGTAEGCRRTVDATLDGLGGIDVLVNNAGVNRDGPLLDMSEADWDQVLNVNLKGPFELCKTAYPVLKKRGGGSIIHISSIGGLTPESGIGIYSVSKAAIINMTKAMAQDWGTDNIRVNAICPGLIETKFSEALWNDETTLERFVKRIPLGRIGEADDIKGLAVYLACDASAYCTGGVYMVDGGYAAN